MTTLFTLALILAVIWGPYLVTELVIYEKYKYYMYGAHVH